MKKLILIAILLLLASHSWAEEQGLECVRHEQIGDTTFTFYNEYIINEEERYILIYPTYAYASVVRHPPETSFKKHPIELSPIHWIFWTTIVDEEEVNYRFIRGDNHLIESSPQYDNVLDCTFMDKATVMSNIRMRAKATVMSNIRMRATKHDIEERDGMVYDLKSGEPFTGKVIYYSHDNKPLYLIYDHDFSHRIDTYEDGKKRWSWYYDEGENQVLCEQYFEDKPVEQWSCLGC